MTINEEILCPHCKQTYKTSLWQRVNTIEQPIYEDELIDDKFFQRTCPHCQHTMYVFHDIVVEYENKSVLLFCSTDKAIFSMIEHRVNNNQLQPHLQQYEHIRVVDSPDVLREKMRIFQMNRDDRIIELIKLAILNELNEKHMIKKIDDVLCWIADDGEMILDFFGEQDGHLRVQSLLYDIFYQKYHNQINSQCRKFSIVDIGWAIDFLEFIET